MRPKKDGNAAASDSDNADAGHAKEVRSKKDQPDGSIRQTLAQEPRRATATDKPSHSGIPIEHQGRDRLQSSANLDPGRSKSREALGHPAVDYNQAKYEDRVNQLSQEANSLGVEPPLKTPAQAD